MKGFKRSQRVADQIRRDAGSAIAEMTRDAGVMITVSRVEVTDDLKYARIFYTVLGEDPEHPDRAKEFFEHSGKRIQSEVAHNLRIRRIPEFSYHFDKALVEGIRVANLIEEVMSEQHAREEDKKKDN